MAAPFNNTREFKDATPMRVRVPDRCNSSVRSAGGKSDLVQNLGRLATAEIREFREPFGSSAAMTFFMIRNRRAEHFWLNDLDTGVSNYHEVVQQQCAALVAELMGLLESFGRCSRDLFDHACQMVESENRVESAAGFYIRNRLSRSGTNGMSGYNVSYEDAENRGLKRVHINRLWQFSEWLQGVRITNVDYSEVMDEPGDNVFVMADPPYANVGKTMYPFGDADLAKLAQRVRASKHSCLVTVDDSIPNRVLFADMNPIVRNYASTMGDHHAASELICANYTTPLYAIHARDIGVMLEQAPVAANSNEDDAVALTVEQEPVTEIDDTATTMPLGMDEMVSNKEWHPRHLFVRQGNEQKNCEWYTPDWLLQHLYAANGNQPFDLDPCSPCKGANAPVWARQHFTLADDGLAQEWHGRVWLNPPYHSLGPWLQKAADAVWCRQMPNAPTQASAERDKPLCETIVGVIPARTHRRYWRAGEDDAARRGGDCGLGQPHAVHRPPSQTSRLHHQHLRAVCADNSRSPGAVLECHREGGCMMRYRLSDRDVTSLAYTGGKAKIAHILARLRPWQFEEYREPFVGGGAVFNYLRRVAPCQRYWINDIDQRVATYHRVLRDDAEVLTERLLDIFAEHGGGTRELYDQWCKWRDSTSPMDIAVSVFLRGQIVRGSETKGFGFSQTRADSGKALTRSKIIRLRGFAELLQGVKITNVDYREVMDAPGRGVFIFSDPPYEGVGEDLYDCGKFDLPEFAAAIDRCSHSCLWTLNSSDNTRAAFARHNVIQHEMRYSTGANDNAKEIIGANYGTPLFEVHAREIGVLLPKVPNTKPMILPAAANENICPITIHNQSCADMGMLSDANVHLTVTSPPYNVGIQYGDQSDDTLTLPDYRALMTQVFNEVYRVTAENGRVCINVANTGRDPYMPLASLFIDLMTEIGFTMRAEIVWNKVGAKSQSCAWGSWCRPSAPAIREHHEHVLVFSKGDWKRSDLKGVQRMTKTEFMEATKSVWNITPEHRSSHPAPFPVELPRRLIKLLAGPTDVVLDPFTGSGTTALAAQELGNRFVGFELEPRWIELAHQRLAEADQQRKAA